MEGNQNVTINWNSLPWNSKRFTSGLYGTQTSYKGLLERLLNVWIDSRGAISLQQAHKTLLFKPHHHFLVSLEGTLNYLFKALFESMASFFMSAQGFRARIGTLIKWRSTFQHCPKIVSLIDTFFNRNCCMKGRDLACLISHLALHSSLLFSCPLPW
jgi:hypothetical protein